MLGRPRRDRVRNRDEIKDSIKTRRRRDREGKTHWFTRRTWKGRNTHLRKKELKVGEWNTKRKKKSKFIASHDTNWNENPLSLGGRKWNWNWNRLSLY